VDDVKKGDLQYVENERQAGEDKAIQEEVEIALKSCTTLLQGKKGGEKLIGFVMEGLKALKEGQNVSKLNFSSRTSRASRKVAQTTVDQEVIDTEISKLFKVCARYLVSIMRILLQSLTSVLVMQAYDTNESNALDKQKISRFLEDLCVPLKSEQDLDEIITLLDIDKSGDLMLFEFSKVKIRHTACVTLMPPAAY